MSTNTTTGKRKLEKTPSSTTMMKTSKSNSNKKQFQCIILSNISKLSSDTKTNKRKIPKDPKTGLPLCRKYMEGKPCDMTKCRFVHVDRNLRAPCPEFNQWGLCPYGDDSCFLPHCRSSTHPLCIDHAEKLANLPINENEKRGETLSAHCNFVTQKNFQYPIVFDCSPIVTPKKTNYMKESMKNNNPSSEIKTTITSQHPFICLFSVASGFLSRFLTRFSEINTKVKSSNGSTIIPIEAFRGFTKKTADDTIGIIFAPSHKNSNPALPHTFTSKMKHPKFNIMFPFTTEIFTSRHSRDEVLFLTHSSQSLHETAKTILNQWSTHMKKEEKNVYQQNCNEKENNINYGIVRVKAFPPARVFTHSLAIHFLQALAEEHLAANKNTIDDADTTSNDSTDNANFKSSEKNTNSNNNNNTLSSSTVKQQSFPILFPTVDRTEMYRDLHDRIQNSTEHNCDKESTAALLSSPFLHSPSSDVGVQDARFELHIAPYHGNWLWGFHPVRIANTASPAASIVPVSDSNDNAQSSDSITKHSILPPILCATIRDTFFKKENAINEIRKLLNLPNNENSNNCIIDSTNSDANKIVNQCQNLPPICRAYWKLYEIMARRPDQFMGLFSNMLNSTPYNNNTKNSISSTFYAVDVGAAPGGWTQFLCDLIPKQIQYRIISIDPSDLNKKIKQHPNVIHIQKRSEHALTDIENALSLSEMNKLNSASSSLISSKGLFNLIVCDANVAPTQTLDLISPMIPLLRKSKTARAIITAKNQYSGGKAGIEKVHTLFLEELEKAKELYSNVGLDVVEVVHLFANSLNETTMLIKRIEEL